MTKKILKKIAATVFMSTMLISSVIVVNASTLKTDYGTMTYSLTKPSSNVVKASTSMPADSKTYSYVKTTLEVQDNLTGKTIYIGNTKLDYAKNTKITAIEQAKNLTAKELAAFSCHEVVGKTAYAKYGSKVF